MSGFSINTVTVSGNLTRDPESSTTPGGTSVCKLGIAVNERVKRDNEWEDRPNYFRVVVFGGIGEWIGRNLRKGDGLVVEGRLRWYSWESQGGKREGIEIIADSIVPMPREGRSSTGSSTRSQQREPAAAAAPSGQQGPPSAPPPGSDDDIPFLWRPAEWDERYHTNR